MSMARCTGCKKVMTHVEFDQHDCPASPGNPLKGESWEDYSARCKKFKQERWAEWGWEESEPELTLPQLDSYGDGPIDGYDY